MRSFIADPLRTKPTAMEALMISRSLDVPLHPRFTYFWEQISLDDFQRLREKLLSANFSFNGAIPIEMTVTDDDELRSLLEKLCIPHGIKNGRIVLYEDAAILSACLNLRAEENLIPPEGDVYDAIEKMSGIKVERKAGVFVGTRMGRPEKARRREMKPLVHSLFPVGMAGGARRDLVEAVKTRRMVSVEITRRRCPNCSEITWSSMCRKCNVTTVVESICPICGRTQSLATCPMCKARTISYSKRAVNIKDIFDEACKRLGTQSTVDVVKGVKALMSEGRIPEPIEKGLIRAKWGLSVFKDGTIRFDVTNAVLSHFRPSEIGVPLDRLRDLGYEMDHEGKPIVKDEQLCPLYVQDVIIPKTGAEYLVKAAKFVDELLMKFYNLPAYYDARSKADLVGHLVVGLSPHTSVGVLGRIVGFTELSVCLAHPLWHAAKRRDCDGDEDSLSLALDVLLNFSKSFLPGRIGGMMDAPLLLTLTVNPSEVARQAFNVEVVDVLPAAFFEETERHADPKIVNDFIDTLSHRVGMEEQLQPIGFTHDVRDLNDCNRESSYKKLESMSDKVREQLGLAEVVKAADAREVAKRLLSTHFMRDLTGNLRAFSAQKLRCTKCNTKYRRVPLSGACTKCGGKISLTVHRRSIEKYLEVAENLVDRYSIGAYHKQRLKLIRDEIASLFAETTEKDQMVLGDFA